MPVTPIRVVPEKGIEVPRDVRSRLEEAVTELKVKIQGLRTSLDHARRDLMPDVEIYHNAVRYALDQDIFREAKEFKVAETLTAQGIERAEQLKRGETPWTSATSLIVRGYRSEVDDSVQPYGLVVPDSYDPAANRRHRLDIWHHGRNLNGTELRFLNDRQTQSGHFTPNDAIVLHTFGRYSSDLDDTGKSLSERIASGSHHRRGGLVLDSDPLERSVDRPPREKRRGLDPH